MKSFQKPTCYICLIVSLLFAPECLCAQGTAFTYQGRLNDSGSPANGNYDFCFQLFNAATNGTAVGPTLTNSATGVSNGLFTVTLDFGTGVFTGPNYWLEIGVRSNGSANAFTALAPLQELTPTPYAVYASTASAISGPLTSSELSGLYTNTLTLNNSNNVFSGNGSGLTNVNAGTVGGFNAAQFWNLTGNAGTTPGVNFLGTTDNEPLQIWANGSRAFLLDGTLDPSSPNVIGGSADNSVAPFFITDTIAGGAQNTIQGDSSTIGGGDQNTCGDDGCTIAGGDQNTIQSATYCSTIAGGYDNTIESGGFNSTIGGGDQNTCGNYASTIGGGENNNCQGGYATIGGGSQNTCAGGSCTIAGGQQNSIQTDGGFSTIAGGAQNTIQSENFGGTIAALPYG